MFNMPLVTKSLIGINILAFLFLPLLGESAYALFPLWPIGEFFMPWQLLSYAFIHANLPHLAFNMLALFMFGSDLERLWGGRRYLQYYLICALSAAITQLLVMGLSGIHEPTVGASGAVFGLLLAFAMEFPERRVMLLIPPIPMRAPTFVILYGVLELVMGITGTQSGVAHFAHLGGLAGGFLMMQIWRYRGRR